MRERRVPLPAHSAQLQLQLQPLDASNLQIPYHFRCPISLELMTDPVTVSTGQTYDRSSIESWVATGNTTCPVTRAPLSDFNLIPNHTLRRLIQDWCVANRSYGVERIPTPKQPADPSHIRSLLNQINSGSSSVQARVNSLRKLRSLARDSDKNRSLISSLHTRDVMLSLLFESNSDEIRHESLSILSIFPPVEPSCSAIASDSVRISFLVSLLFHPSSIEIRVNSAALIESIIAGTKSPELRSHVSNSDEIFTGVISIIQNPIPYPRALKVGVKALFALCLNKQHRARAIACGGVDALVTRLPELLDKCDLERALATVELICRVPQGCAAFGAHALTVPMLVKTILKVSDRATEYAAGALLSLCSTSERLQREAVNAGVLTQLLLLVQSDCTERAKRKAQMLLKLLRESWPDDESLIGNYSDDFNCTDVVPF